MSKKTKKNFLFLVVRCKENIDTLKKVSKKVLPYQGGNCESRRENRRFFRETLIASLSLVKENLKEKEYV